MIRNELASAVLSGGVLAVVLVASILIKLPRFKEVVLTAEEYNERTSRKRNPTLMCSALWLAVFVGMLSIRCYKIIQTGEPFDFRSVVLAAVLSPLVLRATLGSKNEMLLQPWHRLLLNGYQAGFFWQTLLGATLSKS